jgi:hypothetical protein
MPVSLTQGAIRLRGRAMNPFDAAWHEPPVISRAGIVSAVLFDGDNRMAFLVALDAVARRPHASGADVMRAVADLFDDRSQAHFLASLWSLRLKHAGVA